jgi:prepilin-type N-terminal cleavage/methylation domain-containing protein
VEFHHQEVIVQISKMSKIYKLSHGFTLIELLITIAIIGILVTISSFAFTQARQNSRDVRRKADLETIRSGLEMYRSDCGAYPSSLPSAGSQLTGSGGTCSGNVYINSIPGDPISGRQYSYRRINNTSYELCTALESSGSDSCASSNCGSGVSCNYKVVNP